MKTRTWIPALACILFCAAMPAFAQDGFEDVKIKTLAVAGNVHMLMGAGGNIGVSAGKDGVLIVDDQFAPLAEKIRAALRAINPGPLKFILNTHWHGDHTGGNAAFGREGVIIAQDNVRLRLMKPYQRSGRELPASPEEAWPVVTFDASLSVHFNGEEIRVLHFPHGHTDGDSVIFFTGSNAVHMGDHYFQGRFPFVDLDSGGSVQGYMDNVEAALRKIPAGAKIIPGHGDLSTPEEMKKWLADLRESVAFIREKMKAGRALEEIKKEGLPEKFKAMASGFVPEERWMETVHRSYLEK